MPSVSLETLESCQRAWKADHILWHVRLFAAYHGAAVGSQILIQWKHTSRRLRTAVKRLLQRIVLIYVL